MSSAVKSMVPPRPPSPKSSAVSVHRLGRNAGHLALFKARLHKRHRHEWFALTDPDLDLSTLPAAFVADLQTAHAALALGTVRKIGLALRIDNLVRCDPRALLRAVCSREIIMVARASKLTLLTLLCARA